MVKFVFIAQTTWPRTKYNENAFIYYPKTTNKSITHLKRDQFVGRGHSVTRYIYIRSAVFVNKGKFLRGVVFYIRFSVCLSIAMAR